jgi:hypothetical protein
MSIKLVLMNAVMWAATVVAAAIVLARSGSGARLVPLLASAGVVTVLLNLRAARRRSTN